MDKAQNAREWRLRQPKCVFDGCLAQSNSKRYGLCTSHDKQRRAGEPLTKLRQARRLGNAGQITNSSGYAMQKEWQHHYAQKDGYVMVHRLVMEDVLDRYLEPYENVHHLNGRRTDNRPENLELWITSQPSGQRPEDLVKWVIDHYRHEVLNALKVAS